MKTKLSSLKEAAHRGNWRLAISIANKFPRLGIYKEAITRANLAYTNPRFLVQIGKDVDLCINAGKVALIEAYRINIIK